MIGSSLPDLTLVLGDILIISAGMYLLLHILTGGGRRP